MTYWYNVGNISIYCVVHRQYIAIITTIFSYLLLLCNIT